MREDDRRLVARGKEPREVERAVGRVVFLGCVKELLGAAQPDETMLVLSATTQLPDLRNVVAGFNCLRPTSLFFTKLDETRRYGTMVSLLADVGLPLSYFGVGQNVPDDIRLAHPGTVANLITEGRGKRGRSSKQSS